MSNKSIFEYSIQLKFNKQTIDSLTTWFFKHAQALVAVVLVMISIASFVYYYRSEVGLAYNDARSHLDISRRVVEGLKPGLAQLGSVWLPLPHILMIPTIWNDFMWHSGLAGALVSMIAYVATGVYIYRLLAFLQVGLMGRLVGVFVFAINLNILYLQSTAMTELLLLATMTAGSYSLVVWSKSNRPYDLMKAAFWIMLATMVRYDGWFLLAVALGLIVTVVYKKKQLHTLDGVVLFFSSLSAVGIVLWFLWNQLIFGDALYFAFGPFSARAQQALLDAAGELITDGNLFLSLKIYFFAFLYNTGAFTALMGIVGAVALWFHKRLDQNVRIMSVVLIAPFIFNVIALYFGHSVLYVQGLFGDTWFNVRYGIMMMPSIAIFIGFLLDKIRPIRAVALAIVVFMSLFSLLSNDAVTIDDALAGKSQKNVSQVSNWLANNVSKNSGFVLVSAASHDAVIFSSKLPMKRFIHEGTGAYWTKAISNPAQWARWIVMRTNDTNDLTFQEIKDSPDLEKYRLVDKYPFADVYELKEEYAHQVETTAILGKQK